MDWVTLSRNDVENDGLPHMCVYCGRPSSDFTNRTFEWCPEWVNWWYYVGYVPGAILQSMHGRKMRVSLPVCDKHARLPFRLGMVAGFGWLFVPALAGIGALIGHFVGAPSSDSARYAVGAFGGAVLGLIVWIAWLISLLQLQLDADEITDDGILLRGLAHDFVMAVKAKAAVKAVASGPSLNPADLNLEVMRDAPSDGIRQ
jgi:hypothetical protein